MTCPPLSLRIPGSTSNLGPGFDMAGLALDLWLHVVAREAPKKAAFEVVHFEGTARDVQDPSPLFEAFARGARLAGAQRVLAHDFELRSEIPLARGLGSSGAAVAAGLLLGAAWARRSEEPPGPELLAELLDAGTELEGHPDNVVASLLGGCTFAVPTAAGLRVIEAPLHPSLGYVVAWGATPLATSQARAALPARVDFADAVENPRRLVLLLEGLRTGDGDLLAHAQHERLHARYRLPLIPGGEACLTAARDAGAHLATVGGAGSSLLAICHTTDAAAVAAAMGAALETADSPAEARVLQPVHQAPRVRLAP